MMEFLKRLLFLLSAIFICHQKVNASMDLGVDGAMHFLSEQVSGVPSEGSRLKLNELAHPVAQCKLFICNHLKTINEATIGERDIWTNDHTADSHLTSYYTDAFLNMIVHSGSSLDTFKNNICPTISEEEKSNSPTGVIFFTHNREYVIKTMSEAQMQVFSTNKEKYYNHIIADQHKSFLAQMHGLYMHKQGSKAVYVSIWKNIFPLNVIKKQFDFIGEISNARQITDNGSRTLREINFQAEYGHFVLTSNLYNLFTTILDRDLALLKSMHVVGYSFFLGIHENDRLSSLHKPGELNFLTGEAVKSAMGKKIIISFGIIRFMKMGTADEASTYATRMKTLLLNFFKSG